MLRAGGNGGAWPSSGRSGASASVGGASPGRPHREDGASSIDAPGKEGTEPSWRGTEEYGPLRTSSRESAHHFRVIPVAPARSAEKEEISPAASVQFGEISSAEATRESDQIATQFNNLDPQVRTAMVRVEGQLKRELAKAVMLLREEIRDIQVSFREEHLAIESMNRSFEQRSFLLRDEILNVQQNSREEIVAMERSLANYQTASVSDALSVFEARSGGRTDVLQGAVKELQDRVSGLAQKIASPSRPTVSGASALQIANHVVTELRSKALSTTKIAANAGFFDSYGNIVDESFFVQELESALLSCVEEFLPKPTTSSP